ncbi:MAG: hypothetical protein WC812_03135 [Candidatus Pacearchaeota archaeon]|jgi:hypothetical protein
MEKQKKDFLSEIEVLSRKFNDEFEEDLFRCKTVLTYYKEEENAKILTQDYGSFRYVNAFTNLFFNLRTKYIKKYSLDVGESEEKWVDSETSNNKKQIKYLPSNYNKKGIDVSSDLLYEYSKIHDLASGISKKLSHIKIEQLNKETAEGIDKFEKIGGKK